jgi:short-subunit dehydrogenase
MNPLVVVTGGTKGIGRAVVERFVAGGFDVVFCARNTSDVTETERLLQLQNTHSQIIGKVVDISNRNDIDAFGAFVASLGRSVAVLVNNAGTFAPGQIHNEADGTLELMLNTNLSSVYHLTRYILPSMMAAQDGHIFNMCSTASITAYTNGGSYCISKFALYGLTKVLREELKPHNIKVTAILPGATLTGSWEGTDLPQERFMKPQDVAETIWSAYHLSPSAVIEEILMRPQLGDI